MIIPIVRFSYPVQRTCKLSNNNEINFLYSNYERTRSQDLEPIFHDSSSFYWYKDIVFTENYKPRRLDFERSELEVQDIDNLSDWKQAELKYQVLHNADRT